jgi:hypothetical protein
MWLCLGVGQNHTVKYRHGLHPRIGVKCPYKRDVGRRTNMRWPLSGYIYFRSSSYLKYSEGVQSIVTRPKLLCRFQ